MIEIERHALKKFADKGFRGAVKMEASLSEIFHENTKLTPLSSRAYGAWLGQVGHSKVLVSLMSKPFKTYTLMDQVSLPSTTPHSALENLIAARRSVRNYTGDAMTQEELARVLYYSYGITDKRRNFRAVASGGGLFPLEIYVVPIKVQDLEHGIYHYNVEHGCLDVVSRGDRLAEIKECIWFEDIDFDDAAALFIVTAIFERTTLKYQDRGYRMVLMEAGEVAQNLTLAANSYNLGTCLVGGFHDNIVSKILEIDGSYEAPLLPIVVGRMLPS